MAGNLTVHVRAARRFGHCLAAILASGLIWSVPLSSWSGECPKTRVTVSAQDETPPNLGKLKQELINYGCFGDYDADLAKVVGEAQAYVQSRLNELDRDSRPAVVLDIDETSLSNWPEILANDFGFVYEGPCNKLPNGPCGVFMWEVSRQAKAIGPTLAFYKFATAKGAAIFFITGRTEDPVMRAATEANLVAAGYKGWQGLFLRPDRVFESVMEFKKQKRADIERSGYKIIANLGDQWSDLDGGFAEKRFKLPNPFYFLP